MAELEHVNITVPNPHKTAEMLVQLFGWHIRWEGEARDGRGYSVHVGSSGRYLALYSGVTDELTPLAPDETYTMTGGLNHIGVVVDDLDAVEAKVLAAGYTPTSHQDYEPGRRFYFHDHDGIEIEIVSYG